MTADLNIAYYFVDEAGDTTLFGRGGKIIVGEEGVSHLFMVGVAHLPNPAQAETALAALRAALLADPYFKGVPSMRVEEQKTARCFHAKNDLPEVRREVFKLLPGFNATVQVAIRRKAELAEAVKLMNKLGHRYRPDEIYDDLVQRVFKNLLQPAGQNHICFARRGNSPRAHALRLALTKARAGLDPEPLPQPPGTRRHGLPPDDSQIVAAYPHEAAGLQVIDYYLWALQRLLVKGEERFFASVAEGFKLIMDLDDRRNHEIGEWYSETNPLTLPKIMLASS